MSTLAPRQNAFQRKLVPFVNEGFLGAKQMPWACLAPGPARRTAAAAVSRDYRSLEDAVRAAREVDDAPVVLNVPVYAGANAHVLRMMRFVERHLRDDLVGAYVHGSLGSDEEVGYSDFDALVILKADVLRAPDRLARAAGALQQARAIMLDYDPLQHHGWFVLTEFDLEHYCDAYFPVVLFDHAKSLLPEQGRRLVLRPREARDEMREAFEGLAGGIVRRIENRRYPADLYDLKCLLSQFMLLPSLYVQVRDGRGVWKADSFALARPDFDPEVWASMEAVSAIRRTWHLSLPQARRWALTRPQAWGRLVRKKLSPPVPADLRKRLQTKDYDDMGRLVRDMQAALVDAGKQQPASR